MTKNIIAYKHTDLYTKTYTIDKSKENYIEEFEQQFIGDQIEECTYLLHDFFNNGEHKLSYYVNYEDLKKIVEDEFYYLYSWSAVEIDIYDDKVDVKVDMLEFNILDTKSETIYEFTYEYSQGIYLNYTWEVDYDDDIYYSLDFKPLSDDEIELDKALKYKEMLKRNDKELTLCR